MTADQLEMLDHCTVEWIELLFSFHNFEEECKKIFPANPPDPGCLLKYQHLLEEVFFQLNKRSQTANIVVRDQGPEKESLPLVVVRMKNGKERSMSEFSAHELLSMPIELMTEKGMTESELMTLLCFYKVYPLRVERQKKRDSVALLLNVLCQQAQKAA